MARYRPALALLGALSISSAQAAFDGNDVYQWCRTNRSMTLAYSAGIIDQNARVSHTLGITARPPKPDIRIESALELASKVLVGYCAPDQATMTQVTDVFCNYLRDTPAERHAPAAFLFQSAMQKAWPCP